MFGFGTSAKEKLILVDTKVITNAVFDAVNELGINKEAVLSTEDVIEICKKLYADKNILSKLPQFDNIWTQKSLEVLVTITQYGGDEKMYAYPGTVADLYARGYATALLGGHTPSNSLTNKMVKEVQTKFINLGKL